MEKYKNKLFWKTIIFILAIGALTPIVFIFTNSFMTINEIDEYVIEATKDSSLGEGIFKKRDYAVLKLIPEKVTLKQYYNLFIEKSFYLKTFWNSVIILIPVVVGHLIVSVVGGFAFAKLEFPYKKRFFFLYIVTMLMPFQATLVPNYIMNNWLGINESYLAIIIPAIFNPFGVFLMTQFIKYIPDSYIESAKVEGANNIIILIKIIIPMCRNGIISLLVLSSIDVWNMVEQPLIYLKEKSLYPLSIMLTYIDGKDFDILFSSAVIYMIPMIIIFFKGEKHFVEGIEYSQLR